MTAPHIVDPSGLLVEALTDASPDLMRNLLQTMINALLSADADAVVGAEWGKPSPDRIAQRNGYRNRALDTRVGTLDVAIPKLRQGTYYLSAILNRVCLLHEKTPVSEHVTKCCSGSLVERRPCFSALTVDETYVPKEFKAETFTFHSDICTLPEKEKQIKKQTALAELVKHKPKATAEQLKTVMDDFAQFLDTCCKAADKDTCFSTEGPNLVTRCKDALA
nr:transposase [Agrococcus sp. REN33]